jgi:SAM-dependent methyltransferase
VLDLGCGSGYGTALLAAVAAAVQGVDIDAPTIEEASRRVQAANVAFAVRDAVEMLHEDLSAAYETIVCFETLEHLADLPGAQAGLLRQAEAGVELVMSLPNSGGLGEENEFHLTDFDYESAQEFAGRFPGAVVLEQYLAEGSILIGPEAGEPVTKLINEGNAEPDYANHYVVLVNIDPARLNPMPSGLMQIALAPVNNRYIAGLERANSELRARNNELAHKVMWHPTEARASSGAASYVTKLEDEVERLRGELAAKDDLLLAQRQELLESRAKLVRAAHGLET